MASRLLVTITWLLCLSGSAQQRFFTHFAIEKGLSQSVVNCLFQDSQGYIWAGTQNGLNRFDGYNFKIYAYDPGDTTSLSNSWIYSIAEDNDGNLWVGTKNGLNQWLRKENRFRRIRYATGHPNAVTTYPYDVKLSRNGDILVNTPPVLTSINPKTLTCRHFINTLPYDGSVKDNRIPLLADRAGNIWTGSTRGLACFTPRTGRFTNFLHDESDPRSVPDNMITALYEDINGVLWVGTPSGLAEYNNKTGTFRNLRSVKGTSRLLTQGFIRTICGDSTGGVWIGTEGGGLCRVRRSGDELVVTETCTSENRGPAHNIVLDLLIDRSKNLWIGTLAGLSKTDLKPRKFRLYRRDDTPYSTDLLGNVIASLYKDDRGLVWAGNWGQGLNIINRRTGQTDHFSSQLAGRNHIPNDFVHVIFTDIWNNTWIGTRDGILVYDRLKGSFLRFSEFFRDPALPDFRGVRICAILRSRDNSYWIGTQNGLYRVKLNPASREDFTAESAGNHRISGNLIYSLIQDRDGLIWIATLNGLDVFDPVSGTMKHYFKDESTNSVCDDFVISLCEDHRGDIWIGTGSYMNRFVKKRSEFIYYGKEQGLPNNRIFEILEDQRRNIWVATGGGLCRFDSMTGKFRTYSVEEGLQGPEFNLRACCLSNDGEVFFGGMNGFNSFYPDSLKDNPTIPQSVFTSFYKVIRGEKVFVDIEKTSVIDLNYDEPTFTIEFSALEFTNPEFNRYAYRIEGVSPDWVETGTRRFVPFSNLPPGEYTFSIRGSNNDGVMGTPGPGLRIIIHPPWWRTTWAWTAYVLLVAGMILIFIRMRERSLIRERDLLEQKVHLRTLQIEEQNAQILLKNEELNALNETLSAHNATRDRFFSIIAHDLRNPFNTILGLSEIALENGKAGAHEKVTKTMADIRDTARHTFDLLQNLLLWARSQTGVLEFDPVPFDLAERIDENIGLVRSQAGRKGIDIRFTDQGPVPLTGDVHMIDTVLRNLLTNAIKFTDQGGAVTITAVRNDNRVEIRVADTGIGISAEHLERIFRLDNKYTRKGTAKERGSGLGLMLCREFVEKHGGSIGVESEVGRGSTFVVGLPVGGDEVTK